MCCVLCQVTLFLWHCVIRSLNNARHVLSMAGLGPAWSERAMPIPESGHALTEGRLVRTTAVGAHSSTHRTQNSGGTQPPGMRLHMPGLVLH